MQHLLRLFPSIDLVGYLAYLISICHSERELVNSSLGRWRIVIEDVALFKLVINLLVQVLNKKIASVDKNKDS